MSSQAQCDLKYKSKPFDNKIFSLWEFLKCRYLTSILKYFKPTLYTGGCFLSHSLIPKLWFSWDNGHELDSICPHRLPCQDQNSYLRCHLSHTTWFLKCTKVLWLGYKGLDINGTWSGLCFLMIYHLEQFLWISSYSLYV